MAVNFGVPKRNGNIFPLRIATTPQTLQERAVRHIYGARRPASRVLLWQPSQENGSQPNDSSQFHLLLLLIG